MRRQSERLGTKGSKRVCFSDRAAERGAELIPILVRVLDADRGRSVVKEGRRVHYAVLEVFIRFAVHRVAARFRDHADVRAAVGALRCVVHGGADVDFFNRFYRWSRQCLPDRAVDRSARLNRTAGAEVLAGVQDWKRFSPTWLVELPLNKLLVLMPFSEKLLLVSRCPFEKIA